MFTKRVTAFLAAFVASLAIGSSVMAQTQGDPGVIVTIEVENNVLNIGQTTTATVKALVSNPAVEDGIFSFDTDFLVADRSILQVVAGSVVRPDASFGSDGSLVNGPGVGQTLEGVAGAYDDVGRGIGSPQILFTLQLMAMGAGSTTVNVGPSTDFFGFDFLLYSTDTGGIGEAAFPPVPVSYPNGQTIRVNQGGGGSPVPEPQVAMLSLLGLAAAGLYAARRPARAFSRA